jgi:hypothetical protein
MTIRRDIPELNRWHWIGVGFVLGVMITVGLLG